MRVKYVSKSKFVHKTYRDMDVVLIKITMCVFQPNFFKKKIVSNRKLSIVVIR